MTPNEDTLASAIQLEGVATPDTKHNFLYDAMPGRNLSGAVEAVAADIGASFYNLAALTPAFEHMSEDELVKHLSDLGLNDAATYYKDHTQATQLVGLIAGGWKLGAMGAVSLAKLLGRGEVVATEAGQVLSKTLARKQEMTSWVEVMYWQGTAMQDTTPMDLALGVAVGGALSAGLTGIARGLAANKDATAEVALMEHDVVNNLQTLGEATVLAAQRKANDAYVATLDDPRMQDWAKQAEARQLELIDAAMHKDLKVVQGKADSGQYDFNRDLLTVT